MAFSFQRVSPEAAGVSSRTVLAHMRAFDEAGLPMHSVLMARGDKIFYEGYYAPFSADFVHRIYSDTKSFVAIAVGFALQDGLLHLDDRLIDYFPEEAKAMTNEELRKVTLRQMMLMATSHHDASWFAARIPDRVAFYFSQNTTNGHPVGSFFEYDSTGSFVMGALVERLTGKPLLSYLDEKLFSKIGVEGPVRAFTCPGGHTWSDSAFLMRPRDLLRVLRFLAQGGRWEGEQLLDEAFVREATAFQIATAGTRPPETSYGYGYYIWMFADGGFYFNGMGGQMALYLPKQDMYMICQADCQGARINEAKKAMLTDFYENVAKAAGEPLPEDPEAYRELNAYTEGLKLYAARGEKSAPAGGVSAESVSGRVYRSSGNPMGIEKFSLQFNGDEGVFRYKNAQGDKEIPFGLCKNVFGFFPEEGYSDTVGSQKGNRLYRDAVSGAWQEDGRFLLNVQVIDDYFGNMQAYFAFSPDGREVKLTMQKIAEDFLATYQGEGVFSADKGKERNV